MKPLTRIAAVLGIVVLAHGAEVPVASPTNKTPNPVPTVAATPPQELSSNVNEVLRLAEAGVEEAIIIAFVEAAQVPFDLSADEVIYLKDIGIGSSVVTAMLHQDAVLQQQKIETGIATSAAPPTTIPPSNAPPGPAPVYVTNAPPQVAYFYNSLAPYGTWIELEGLGWCWQPRVAVIDSGWRPYWQGGRWVYTDFDWYWYSDYTWGWAPFHYGRWHRHPRCGWVWFPDLVWAPAWVCWRYSDVYCGWAPLPPGATFVVGRGLHLNGVRVGVDFDFHLGIDFFTFVEIGHFHEHHLHLHGVPRTRIHDVYRNTTVINNYVVGRNSTVINHGVPVGRVAVASKGDIHPVEVREARAEAGGRQRPERLETTAKTPVLYRPQLQTPPKAPSVMAQRVDSQHPIIRQPARPPAVGAPSRDARTTIGKPATPTPRAPTQPQPVQPRTQPVAPPHGQPAPAQPHAVPGRPQTTPTHPALPPARAESPKVREQRLSNGRHMERLTPLPPTPHQTPAGQPHGYAQPQREQRKSGTH